MRVEGFLRQAAAERAGKTALVAGGRRLTFGELDSLSDRLAAGLQQQGVAHGDRVAVFMDNCWEAAVTIFAVLKAGAVFMPVNPATKAQSLAFLLANSRARAVVTLDRFAPIVAETLAAFEQPPAVIQTGTPSTRLANPIAFDALLATEAPLADHGGSDADLGMLIYTSGTTGRPKGVMMAHASMDAVLASTIQYLQAREDDVILSVLPMSFSYGLYQLFMAVRTGATLVLEKSFAFPQTIFDLMKAERVTAMPLVPTMIGTILSQKDLEPGAFPDLRYVTSAAAALSPAHALRLQDLLPHVRIFVMYGQTECKRISWMPPERLREKPDSAGIAIPGTETYVVDERGERLPAGETGELVVRGPHLMKGYWEDAVATARSLRPAPEGGLRLHTGDLFRMDAEGFLFFVARMDDIIKTRGEKVSPREVENVLCALDGVAEAAVFGVPDPILGAAVVAVVTPRPGAALTPAAVISHCAARLDDVMVPRQVEVVAAMPKSANGKIAKSVLAADVQARRAAGGDGAARAGVRVRGR